MAKTLLGIENDRFTINGKLTYSDIPRTHPQAHGLLMNARFIQGIFDDRADPDRFSRKHVPMWAKWTGDHFTTTTPTQSPARLRPTAVVAFGGCHKR